MPAEHNEANPERTRNLRLTLNALEQAQETLHAANLAAEGQAPAETDAAELEKAQTASHAALIAAQASRIHAETDRLAQRAPTTRKAADNTLIFALDTLADCLIAMLGDDVEETEEPATPQIIIRTGPAADATVTAPEQADTERNRNLRLTLAALEQAQEHFYAARIADYPETPRETAEAALAEAEATFYTIRTAAQIIRMARTSPTLAETADAMTDAALESLNICIQTLLQTDIQIDLSKPHNSAPVRKQRLDTIRATTDATEQQSRDATLTDAERAERRKHLLECLEALSQADSAMQNALNAARSAGPDIVAAIIETDESIAISIEATSFLLGGL